MNVFAVSLIASAVFGLFAGVDAAQSAKIGGVGASVLGVAGLTLGVAIYGVAGWAAARLLNEDLGNVEESTTWHRLFRSWLAFLLVFLAPVTAWFLVSKVLTLAAALFAG